MVVEGLSFGDEFATDGCAACADRTYHLSVVVIERDHDGSLDFTPRDRTHEFHGFFSCFGETFGPDLDRTVVVDVDRSAADNVPFVSGIENHLAVLL